VDLARVRKNAADFGWPAALHAIAQRALNRVVFFRVYRCLQIRDVDPAFLAIESRYQHRFLDEETLRRFSREPRYDLSPAFVDEALAKGDECYGILDGDRLANFGWYSRQPTKLSDDLLFCFDPRHVYMYKGFTDPEYRGRRLHSIAMTWALKRLRERGADGLVSYVDATNFDSLRSCYRMGYRDVGQIYCVRAANQRWVHADAGCRRSGISVEPV
jgi:ribosomal protein S18 acetylase RimI-like enzyme